MTKQTIPTTYKSNAINKSPIVQFCTVFISFIFVLSEAFSIIVSCENAQKDTEPRKQHNEIAIKYFDSGCLNNFSRKATIRSMEPVEIVVKCFKYSNSILYTSISLQSVFGV